ncbi:hypothetical protein [Thalassospira sp. MCCC 1A03138]|uniref:hypothetical protein n=1 Tax=Thalassospira sp. MCCC 1A03138 TaxID=1470576 RepID=UPI000A1E415D|nr:hypothetical protein [Thalassospira sp. MCCC 1A03138]OSQ32337.1 hypothetical protein TH468_01635 [Thalassospira sp. MCCC 1A03138]
MAKQLLSSMMLTMLSALLFLPPSGVMAQQVLPSAPERKSDIIWAIDATMPGFIKIEDGLNGYGAQMLDWFIARMPDYHHLVKILPRRSAYDAMRMTAEADDTICIPGTQNTPERASEFILSNTVAPLLPLSVVVPSSALTSFRPYMFGDGTIDLEALLDDTSRYTALAKSRTYGPDIDRILAEAIDSPNVLRTDNQSSFPLMLEMGRIDWMLAFPAEIESHRRAQGKVSDMVSLPIGGMPRFLDLAIACNRSPTGINAIAKVNDILATNPDMPWLDYYVDYLGYADRARFSETLRDFKTARDIPAVQ